MTNFEDIRFEKHPVGGIKGSLNIKDKKLSVIAGEGFYSTPRESLSNESEFSAFEVAVLDKDGGFCTQKFIEGDDVLGWMTREDINELIEKIIEE